MAQSPQTVMKNIRFYAYQDKIQVVLDLNRETPFQQMTLNHPARIVVDVPNAYPQNVRKLNIHRGSVDTVRIGTGVNQLLRVVVDLNQMAHYQIYSLLPDARNGHRIIIDVYHQPINQALSTPAHQPAPIVNPPVVHLPPPTALPPVSQPLINQPAVPPEPKINPVVVAPAVPLVTPKTNHPPQKALPVVPKQTAQQSNNNKKTPIYSGKKNITVVIDAGHGGKDPGASNKIIGLLEKDVTLLIAKRLKVHLEQLGIKAILTRDRDIYLPLRQRTEIARRHKADLFISIHADAVASGSPVGSSVYILSTRGATSELAKYLEDSENQVDLKWEVDVSKYDDDLQAMLLNLQVDSTIESSNVLAETVLNQLGSIGEVHKKRVERANFVVLRSPDIPSILVETAFISTLSEARLLATPQYQDQLAMAIAQGVVHYFQNHLPQHLLLNK